VFTSANNVFVGVVKTRRRQGLDKSKFGKVGKIFTDSDLEKSWNFKMVISSVLYSHVHLR